VLEYSSSNMIMRNVQEDALSEILRCEHAEAESVISATCKRSPDLHVSPECLKVCAQYASRDVKACRNKLHDYAHRVSVRLEMSPHSMACGGAVAGEQNYHNSLESINTIRCWS